MFNRSTCSLGLTAFTRPIRILATPYSIPRVTAASTQLGIQTRILAPRLLHSSIRNLQQDQERDTRPSKHLTETTPPQTTSAKPFHPSRPPTDHEMNVHIPGFSALDVDAKLAHIGLRQSYLEAKKQKRDPTWTPEQYEAMTEKLAMKKKEIEDADTWYKQMFRSIAWGPTILINAIMALIFS